MSILARNNVHIRGTGNRAMLFSHGFGCDQDTWRYIAPSFQRDFVTILFDHVGAGRSHLAAYSTQQYSNLEAYAEDVVQIGRELDLQEAVIVGHCSGAMIAALAAAADREMFTGLIMIAPSARYLDGPNYTGGFSEAQVTSMLKSLEDDYPTWSQRMAPLFLSNSERDELGQSLIDSFQRYDPVVARDLAQAMFRGDLREELPRVQSEALILQCDEDWMAPRAAGEYVRSHLPHARMAQLSAKGHFPQLTAPHETVLAISTFLQDLSTIQWRPTGSPSAVPEMIRRGLRILEATHRAHMDGHDSETLESRRETLLLRCGELWMHLGRYDMYAVTLQELLGAGSSDVERFSIRNRGDDILQRLSSLSHELSAHFTITQRQLDAVLTRNEISARHGAVIPGVWGSLGSAIKNKGHHWFDQTSATMAELDAARELIEKDLLKVVSLCFRVAHCALGVQKLNPIKT